MTRDEYKALCLTWQRLMEDELRSNLDEYFSDGYFDYALLRERTSRKLTEEYDVKDEWIEDLDNLIAKDFESNLEEEAKDLHKEGEANAKDPLGYHGVRQDDFLPPV